MLRDKAGLVTGAASGIGRACALRLATEDAAVVVSDLESARDRCQQTAREIAQAGGPAEFVACDVADEQEQQDLVDHVVRTYGRLDFAHNNAGIGPHALLADTSAEDFDRTVRVNLRGTFLVMKHQFRQMLRDGGGSIVNTSSNACLRGAPQIGAYAATKHGVIGLTSTAAVEYGEQGIRVNAVCPGVIRTPLTTRLSEERQAEICAPQAIKRVGEPTDVAAAVAWLCSAGSSFVTGAAMPVDAGSVAGL
ncbi:SDR family oxidoreductase [Saccharopolyspora halophila]|uniref:SDR family oxidoreductase n=1 Tax=Saccharopolyspora halophila TaxID=405551 RepID=A0ABN3GSD4_9PSEU